MPLSRSTVASPPGPTTVLRKSWWSYWRHTHDLSAMVGVASSVSSSPDRSVPSGKRGEQRRRGVGGLERVLLGGAGERAVVHGPVAEARRRARRRSTAVGMRRRLEYPANARKRRCR